MREAIARWTGGAEALDIDAMVAALSGLRGPQGLDVAYRSGRLIADMIGPREPRRRSRSIEPATLARLAGQTDPLIDRSAVYRALRVFDVCRNIPAILTSRSLTVSHVVAVLRIDPQMQEQLLRKADSEGWTARQLKIAVDEIAGRQPRTGRPKTSGVSKTLKLLAQPDRAFEGIDSLLALDKNAAAELLAICRKAQDCIKRAERALEHATLGHSRLGVLLVDPDRTFALRAQRQLRGQASMIRIVASAAEAKEALAGDTACAIINVSLPDCSAVALANTLRQLRPSIRIIFLTSRAGRALPASLRELEPLVEKTTGLHLLKIALAKALAEKSPNIDPGC